MLKVTVWAIHRRLTRGVIILHYDNPHVTHLHNLGLRSFHIQLTARTSHYPLLIFFGHTLRVRTMVIKLLQLRTNIFAFYDISSIEVSIQDQNNYITDRILERRNK